MGTVSFYMAVHKEDVAAIVIRKVVGLGMFTAGYGSAALVECVVPKPERVLLAVAIRA